MDNLVDLGALQIGFPDLGALQPAPAAVPPSNLRVTQAAREALQSSSGGQKLRVTQAAREALQSSSGAQRLRVTHIAREVLAAVNPVPTFIRVTQVALESLEQIYVPIPGPCDKVVRGTISPEQIQGALRQGDSSVVIMAKEGYVFTSGFPLTTDECGNVVEAGMPLLEPFLTNSELLCRVFPGGSEPPSGCKPAAGATLNTAGPLYSAIQQAWIFSEGANPAVVQESRHGITAAVDLGACQWITDTVGDCEDASVLEINGGYPYPAEPHALIPDAQGFLPKSAPLPSVNDSIVGPDSNIDTSLMSVVIRFKAYDTNNYNQARTTLFVKSFGDASQYSIECEWLQQNMGGSNPRQTWFMLKRYWRDDFSSLQEEGFRNPTMLFDGNYHTIVMVTAPYNTQGQWKFYVDGVLQTNDIYSGPIAEPPYPNSGMSLRICTDDIVEFDSYGHPLWGTIDTLQFYNRQLTPVEVADLTANPYLIWEEV